jgi:hypothetical protein
MDESIILNGVALTEGQRHALLNAMVASAQDLQRRGLGMSEEMGSLHAIAQIRGDFSLALLVIAQYGRSDLMKLSETECRILESACDVLERQCREAEEAVYASPVD